MDRNSYFEKVMFILRLQIGCTFDEDQVNHQPEILSPQY